MIESHISESSSYDRIAGMYHRFWNDWYLPAALPALDRLFFSRLAPPAPVLDLCCGSGHVTSELVRRGYRVTGVDASASLIAFASESLPGACFKVQDARALDLDTRFDGVISTFDSLNHILEIEDLRQVFARVFRVLNDDGIFVFDMNLAEAYLADLSNWEVTIEDDQIALVRGTYDREKSLANTELIWFVRNSGTDCWSRRTSNVQQRCYPQQDILDAVRQAGFNSIETISAKTAGVTSGLAFGRIFVSAWR